MFWKNFNKWIINRFLLKVYIHTGMIRYKNNIKGKYLFIYFSIRFRKDRKKLIIHFSTRYTFLLLYLTFSQQKCFKWYIMTEGKLNNKVGLYTWLLYCWNLICYFSSCGLYEVVDWYKKDTFSILKKLANQFGDDGKWLRDYLHRKKRDEISILFYLPISIQRNLIIYFLWGYSKKLY